LYIAVEECGREMPGVLLIDDVLLAASPGMIDQLATKVYPRVYLAAGSDPHAMRRALAVGARDLVDEGTWSKELLLALERVAQPLVGSDRAPGRIITIFSPKGGVGKTTISVNLALALAEKRHEKVILVDLDLAFGDVSLMMGLTPTTTLHELMGQSIDLTRIEHVVTKFASNVFVLPAPLHPEEAEDVHPDDLSVLLLGLKEYYTYVIVDLAPGYDDLNVTALDLSDVVLTVCTPDIVALRTVSQALQLFREGFHYPPRKVRVALNRSGSKTGISVDDVTAILGHPVNYELPSEGTLPVRAANEGVPLMRAEPTCHLSAALDRIADVLVREDVGGRRAPKHLRETTPFWKRWRPS
jgi:pilus assembly protein CpaE